jgi:LysR family hydrogen peroxide-inducible transcriptional activator
MVAGGLGVTILPRLALAGGVANGAPVALRPVAGGGGRRIGLAWRARSPRADEFRALAPSIAAALADL